MAATERLAYGQVEKVTELTKGTRFAGHVLFEEVDRDIRRLAAELGTNTSAIVNLAMREFAQRHSYLLERKK